jgi:hypothetical protein
MGTTFIIDGKIVPLALGHLRFRRGSSFEQALNREALEKEGAKEWRKSVVEAVATLKSAFLADYVVLGGGNAKKMNELPPGCRRGGNHNAYFGGLRMWDDGAKAAAVPSDNVPTDKASEENARPALAVFDNPAKEVS